MNAVRSTRAFGRAAALGRQLGAGASPSGSGAGSGSGGRGGGEPPAVTAEWGLGVVDGRPAVVGRGGAGGGEMRFWPIEEAGVETVQDVLDRWGALEGRLAAPSGDGLALDGSRRLGPPFVPKRGVMCIGKNYLEHVGEVDSTLQGISRASVPEHPIVFHKLPSAVSGQGDSVRAPTGSVSFDYEGELGVVIGKAGKDIAKGEAWGHVFGFTVCNDLTDRQVQKRHQQWFLGKSGDGMLPLGPVVVPKARMPAKIELTTTVNGELRQHCASCLDTLIFDVPELLATISRSITLEVGDVIATGTPKGVCSGFKPPKFLVPGDRVDVAVGGIGKLTTYIV